MLGNYNHLSYYQPPTFLHSGDHIKSINHQLNNPELKEHTPLDLISKMHLEKGNIEQRNSSPSTAKSVQFQHFPFKQVFTSLLRFLCFYKQISLLNITA